MPDRRPLRRTSDEEREKHRAVQVQKIRDRIHRKADESNMSSEHRQALESYLHEKHGDKLGGDFDLRTNTEKVVSNTLNAVGAVGAGKMLYTQGSAIMKTGSINPNTASGKIFGGMSEKLLGNAKTTFSTVATTGAIGMGLAYSVSDLVKDQSSDTRRPGEIVSDTIAGMGSTMTTALAAGAIAHVGNKYKEPIKSGFTKLMGNLPKNPLK